MNKKRSRGDEIIAIHFLFCLYIAFVLIEEEEEVQQQQLRTDQWTLSQMQTFAQKLRLATVDTVKDNMTAKEDFQYFSMIVEVSVCCMI